MRRVIVSVVISLITYALVDILIWQRIFEENELWDIGIGTYHLGWQAVLIGLMVLGAFLLLPNIVHAASYAASLFILAHSGLEDILYYVLDGRVIPERLPWLDQAPLIFYKPVTNISLCLSALTWIVLICVFWFLVRRVYSIQKYVVQYAHRF